MGSAPKPIKKIVKAVDKAVTKPIVKVSKKIVKPLEKPVKKVAKGIEHIAKEGFEEIIEKPGKKIIREVVDTVTGSDKYSRGTPRPTESAPETAKDVTGDLSAAARRSQVAGATGTASRRRFVEPTKLKKS